MPYAEQWGEQAKLRSKKRLKYFKKAIKGFRKGNHLKLKGEAIARKLLSDAVYVDKPSHDFELEGKKIEVKYANAKNRWYFHITNEKQLTADYFLLIFFSGDNHIQSCLVPIDEITQKHTISCTLDKFSEYSI